MSAFQALSATGHSLICAILLIAITLPPCSSTFQVGDNRLDFSDSDMAIAYDEANETILLLGGWNFAQHFAMFKDGDFMDKGPSFFGFDYDIYGVGQFYTQLSNILWMIRADGDGFYTFDTKTYEIESPSIVIPTTVHYSACLTSIDDYLIVIGGGPNEPFTPMDTVQIYHLTDEEWLLDIPSLQTPRYALTCVVANNKLYAIGGLNNLALNSIEVLDISNIAALSSTNIVWHYMGCTLQKARDCLRAAVYGTDTIYIVGGWKNTDNMATSVDIINTVTDECFAGEDLNFAVCAAPCMIVTNTLFVFGGQTELNGKEYIVDNRYQYLSLPTSNPTNHPTSSPLYQATANPTEHRTNDPSVHPTKAPMDSTAAPTTNPMNPTMHPTTAPVHVPSMTPTNLPTDSTMNPTKFPVVPPTFNPTSSLPTISPLTPLYTSVPTIKETEGTNNVGLLSSTLQSSDASSEEKQGMDTKTDTGMWLRLTVIACAVCVCCGCSFGACYSWKQYTKTMQQMRKSIDGNADVTEDVRPPVPVPPDTPIACADKQKVAMVTSDMNGEDMLANWNDDERDIELIAPCDSDHDSDDAILDEMQPTIGGMDAQKDDDNEGDFDEDDEKILEAVHQTVNGDEFVACDESVEVNEDVQLWLESIGCGQYFDVFRNNGFDSMDFVKEINDVTDLERIGITLRGHQLKIVNNVKKLKQ